jgi:hypothetical protein
MRQRKRPPPDKGDRRPADQTPTFRKRFDDLERRRASLLQRLEHIESAGHSHPAAKRALVLLNQTFRKATLVQRLAVLQAADWFIRAIEMSLPTL